MVNISDEIERATSTPNMSDNLAGKRFCDKGYVCGRFLRFIVLFTQALADKKMQAGLNQHTKRNIK